MCTCVCICMWFVHTQHFPCVFCLHSSMSQNIERLQTSIQEKRRILRDTVASTEVCVCLCVHVSVCALNTVCMYVYFRIWRKSLAVWINVVNRRSIKRHTKPKTSVLQILKGIHMYVCMYIRTCVCTYVRMYICRVLLMLTCAIPILFRHVQTALELQKLDLAMTRMSKPNVAIVCMHIIPYGSTFP